MALNIKSAKADRLARALAARTGETITQAVERALEERLVREEGRRVSPSLEEEILEIARRCASLPDLDTRAPDEILGYDEDGLPR